MSPAASAAPSRWTDRQVVSDECCRSKDHGRACLAPYVPGCLL